jgi:hypothetical protein
MFIGCKHVGWRQPRAGVGPGNSSVIQEWFPHQSVISQVGPGSFLMCVCCDPRHLLFFPLGNENIQAKA